MNTRTSQSLTRGNLGFALHLLKQVSAGDKNVVFSPFSISACMALLYAGARGETEAQIAQVLGFPAREEMPAAFAEIYQQLKAASRDSLALSIANGLWLDQKTTFLPEYLEEVRKPHQARLERADFTNAAESVRQAINQWGAEQTRGKIQNILPPDSVDRLTQLVLVNGIYFKGKWVSPFETSQTRSALFHVSADQQVSVPMMNITDRFGYAVTKECQALALPYDGNKAFMVILLPAKGTSVSDLAQSLSVDFLHKIECALSGEQVNVSIPKFKLEAEYQLAQTLAEMGMPSAFNWQADFSGLDGTTVSRISHIIHKAFVEVNEEGAEATAASLMEMILGIPCGEKKEFKADRPFLFLIGERTTGTLLFMGLVTKP